MKDNTESLVDSILARVMETAIPIDWKSDSPLPRVGERKSSFRGSGTEFFEFTYYRPGDDVRSINWAATAKSGGRTPMRIVYQQEKQIDTHVLVNIDASMEFGTTRCSKRMLAAEMVASIFHSVAKTRDRAGLTVFSQNGVEDEVAPGSVVVTLYPALISVIETESKAPPASKKHSDGLSRALSGLPVNRCLVFIVSDFMNMSPADWGNLANAALVHDVICVYVQDLRERELPKVFWPGCAYELQGFDGQSRLVWNNASTRRRYAAHFQRHEMAIRYALKERHCDVVVVSTEEGDAAIPKILTLFGGHA